MRKIQSAIVFLLCGAAMAVLAVLWLHEILSGQGEDCWVGLLSDEGYAVIGLFMMAVALLGLGLYVLRNCSCQRYDRIILENAKKQLEKKSSLWNIRVDCCEPLPHASGLGVLIQTRPRKVCQGSLGSTEGLGGAPGGRFALLVLPLQGVLLKKTLYNFFGWNRRDNEALLQLNGMALDPDPCDPLILSARAVSGVPVLWLPGAKRPNTFKMKCGLLVVQGDVNWLGRCLMQWHA